MKVTYKGELRLGALGEGVMEPKEYLLNKESLDLAAELDRFDMFAKIDVDPDEYEKKDGGAGIERVYEIHGDGPVVFEHQSGAAEDFLKRLRGIGILADEVGMGKTFEAGVVLAELANVVSLRSLLIVARNMGDWVSVMASFGIDKIMTVKTAEEIRKKSPRGLPSVPMIMDMSDFEKAGDGMTGVLFDAVVVDEAHNLSDDGMYALSVLMRTKNEKNMPYCILVSGTPHKGNLENLFPLWYFFHKRGVNFERFDRVTDREKPEYTQAKKYFIEECCHGARTIAEFVDKSWERALRDGYGEKADAEKFRAFRKKLDRERKAQELPPFGEKAAREKFLELSENAELKARIERKIGDDYNDNLIGSFMIRQSRMSVARPRAKKAKNFYFCPLPRERFSAGADEYVGDFYAKTDSDRTDGGSRQAFRYRVRWKELFTGKSIERYDTGERFTLAEFAKSLYDPEKLRARDKERVADTRYKEEMSDILFAAIEKLGAAKSFQKRNSVEKNGFYYKNFTEDARNRDVENIILFVDESADRFALKAERFAEIVRGAALKDEKIVVFFDDDAERYGRGDTEPERLYRYFSERPDYADILKRAVFFGKDRFPGLTKAEREKEAARICSDEFRDTEAAILFLAPPLGEGFNFQYDCHTIVNFSVSADPVKTDQSIGRVDRIGQTSDMLIVSLADMDETEGYVLSFYNRIKMFSAWQSDIILVSGCNSETAVKQCPKCLKIVLATDGQSEFCENCGVKFGPLKGESYECDLCGFRLVQTGATNRVHNYAYLCKHREKLAEPVTDDPNETVFMCDKACAVMHCTKLTAENCEVKRLMKAGIRHKDLVKVCRTCRRQGLNALCRWCSVEYDVFGGDGEGGKPQPFHCAGCRENSCRDDIFRVAIKADGTAKCPECEKAGRDGKLVSNSQKTFQAFVKKIWEFRAPDGTEDFVSNFSGEVNKVRAIIDTLSRR